MPEFIHPLTRGDIFIRPPGTNQLLGLESETFVMRTSAKSCVASLYRLPLKKRKVQVSSKRKKANFRALTEKGQRNIYTTPQAFQ